MKQHRDISLVPFSFGVEERARPGERLLEETLKFLTAGEILDLLWPTRRFSRQVLVNIVI
jgi:hypothetical protein